MFIKMLKSKLHGALVTDTKRHYAGSIAIDADLMNAADIKPYETVMLADITNGSRLETYAVPAPAGSGDVIVLGAAAHLVQPKDIIIIFSFAYCTPEEAAKLKPRVIALHENNRIKHPD
jgi:aspartate 1-decarboxylase